MFIYEGDSFTDAACSGLQKVDGCNKMTCTSCKQYFCWLCLGVLSRANPYSHFNNPHSPCYNQWVTCVCVCFAASRSLSLTDQWSRTHLPVLCLFQTLPRRRPGRWGRRLLERWGGLTAAHSAPCECTLFPTSPLGHWPLRNAVKSFFAPPSPLLCLFSKCLASSKEVDLLAKMRTKVRTGLMCSWCFAIICLHCSKKQV